MKLPIRFVVIGALFASVSTTAMAQPPMRNATKDQTPVLVLHQRGSLIGDQTLYCQASRLVCVNKTWNTTLMLDATAQKAYFYNSAKKVYMQTSFDQWPGLPGLYRHGRHNRFGNCSWYGVSDEKLAGLTCTKCVLTTPTKRDNTGRAVWFSQANPINESLSAFICKDIGLPQHRGCPLRLATLGLDGRPHLELDTVGAKLCKDVPSSVFSHNFAGFCRTTSPIDVSDAQVEIDQAMAALISLKTAD